MACLLGELYLSPYGIRIMGEDLVVSKTVEVFQRKLRGDPRYPRLKETVVRELKERLNDCPDDNIRRRILEQIPELA